MPTYSVPTHRQDTKQRPHNSVAWRKASAAWLQQYPLCVLCLVRGQINRGALEMAIDTQRNVVVDHIEPHRGNSDLFWDQTNWQTLCRMPCHDTEKQRHEQRGKSAEQWFNLLRDEMRRHDSVTMCRELLPEHIWQRLCPPG